VADYEDLISAMIKKFMTVVQRETIIDVANTIEGLQVDNRGNVVSLTRAGGAVFEELYKKYKAMGGGAARIFAKQAIKSIIESNPGLTVPDELR
jgi:hypothetical protein